MCQKCWGCLTKWVKLAQRWGDRPCDPDSHLPSHVSTGKHASAFREAEQDSLEEGEGGWLRRAGAKQRSGPFPLPDTHAWEQRLETVKTQADQTLGGACLGLCALASSQVRICRPSSAANLGCVQH